MTNCIKICPGDECEIQTILICDELPCLKKGTLINTSVGTVPIESVKNGDFILDQYNNEIEIINIKKEKRRTEKFYICKKNSFKQNVPNKDLTISALHIVKYNNKLFLPKLSKQFKK